MLKGELFCSTREKVGEAEFLDQEDDKEDDDVPLAVAYRPELPNEMSEEG